MAGTPNSQRMEAYIMGLVCGHCDRPMSDLIRFGRYNKRPIAGTSTYSQHAAWQKEPRYRGNALDIHQQNGAKAPNAPHLEWLANHLLEVKGDYHDYGMGLYHILWNRRSLTTGNPVADHVNHVHIDFVGKMINRYPDRHPSDGYPLRVKNYGDLKPPELVNEFVLYPDDGYTPPPPTTDPEGEEEMLKEYIEGQQENLNAAGFTDYEGKPLVVDGDYGDRTQSAEAKRDQAAAAINSLPDHAHHEDGITGGVVR